MPLRLPDRLPRGTLRTQLAAWNTAVVLSMTVAALVAARYAARATLYDDADRELRAGAREVVLALEDLFPDMTAVAAEMRRKAASHEERGWFTQLLKEDGTRIWTSEHCPDAVASFPPHNFDRLENIVQVGPYRYVRLRIARPNQPVFHVRVGTYTTGLDLSLEGLVRLLLVVGGALCAVTPLAGYWLAGRATRPVADILSTANRLRPTRLGDRLPIRGAGDELDRLAVTINRLLDDVADHVERQDRFVADAAHELRGPLTAMQSLLDLAVSQDRSAAAYRETLLDVLEAARHLAKLTNDLLLMAEMAEGSTPRMREPVDLGDVAEQTVRMFAGVAEERGVAIAVERRASPIVGGDAGRLRQVVGNLLDNALRFTPRGGGVTVEVGDGGSAGLLKVRDTGVGIPAANLERIFDRFATIDPARTASGGSRSGGLGLAICKSLVEHCGGSISIASRPAEGTEVTIRIPAWNEFSALRQAGETVAAGPRP